MKGMANILYKFPIPTLISMFSLTLFWSYLDIVLKLTFAENEWQVAFIKFSFRIVADDFNIDIGSILLRVYRQNYKYEWLGMFRGTFIRWYLHKMEQGLLN